METQIINISQQINTLIKPFLAKLTRQRPDETFSI